MKDATANAATWPADTMVRQSRCPDGCCCTMASSGPVSVAVSWLRVKVELELVGVGAEPDRVELAGPLVVHPGLDQVRGEHPAVEQVGVIGLQGAEYLIEGPGYLVDGERLVGRQLVQVLVHWLGRLDLVPDAVDARHQHRGECQVGVGGRIRNPELQPLGLGVGTGDRDPYAGGPVAL